MKTTTYLLFFVVILFSCQQAIENKNTLSVTGLTEEVEVIRDPSGINHIYAKNQRDLFFAQGYCAAKDRLFQFEIWRRQATGTVSEILGERELKRDIGTRLFKFRGDMKTEMNYYHLQGEEIITAYTDGVNAYIEEVLQNPELLPITFKALNIKPEKWTPDVVISRHQGLLGNIGTELSVGRAVAKIGPEKVKKYLWLHPKEPNLELDTSITEEMLSNDILELYNAYRTSVKFKSEDIVPEFASTNLNNELNQFEEFTDEEAALWLGSNNWVTKPELTANGHAYMANDPHRRLAVPSLRYWVHLNAPGWNVIGGGEPEIPGVSIGHNDHGAWGLTVFRTDGEDLYVYDLNPENLNQYKYQDGWKDMSVVQETIPVKGQADVTVDLRYTQHGPVTLIDSANYKAYAVRCAWMEPGGSPYLASLRMDQAKTWEEFREACNYSHIPGENMIWADKKGNIGWQAVGIAPLRRNFSGMVPVPGDGRYEWDGYLPIKQKPNSFNPESGFIATANQNVTPDDYTEWDAITFSWSDPYRGERVNEVLSGGKKLTMEDMKSLQTDYLSIPARNIIPHLTNIKFEDSTALEAQRLLNNWDFVLSPNSTEAAIYIAFEKELQSKIFDFIPDPEIKEVISSIQITRIINWLNNDEVITNKNEYIKSSFLAGLEGLKERFGSDLNTWKYGDEKMKHVTITHPLGNAVNPELQAKLNTEVMPRGGNSYTPGATGGGYNQTAGATFRIIVDVNDWDASVGTNSPGQSGDPDSPFYKNLYSDWATDQFFPVYFSKNKIDSVGVEKVFLAPKE